MQVVSVIYLSRISLIVQMGVVLVLLLFFFTGWLTVKRFLMKIWALAWLLDFLALASVAASTFFLYGGFINRLLYFLYSILKTSFLSLLILGVLLVLGYQEFDRFKKYYLGLSLVFTGIYLWVIFAFSPAHLQGVVDIAIGLMSLVTGLKVLGKRIELYPIKLLSSGLIFYGAIFLHHGFLILPLFWGRKPPRYMGHISFVDAIVELVLGVFIFLSYQIYSLRKVKLMNLQLEENQRKLRSLVDVDPLTGLYNRRKLREYALGLQWGILAFIDIDDFKQINDRWGHEVGDEYLKAMAEVLKSSFRSEGLFRIGGDEFLIVSFQEDKESFQGRIEEMRSRLRRIRALPSPLRISVGISEFGKDKSFSQALHEADLSMYSEKREKKT